MGTWTAFVFNAEIKQESAAEEQFLFDLDLRLADFRNRISCYFPTAMHCAVFRKTGTDPFDTDNVVSICCSIKNYNNQIESFLGWINPHLVEYAEKTNCLGYKQVMENNTMPEFIFRQTND